MQPRATDPTSVAPVTRLSLLLDINVIDPNMWQDLIDNAEEIWSIDWEHEQPEQRATLARCSVWLRIAGGL
jgi:hypothetical protein